MLSFDLAVTLAIIIFVVCILVCMHMYEKKRQKQLEKVSREIGFTYTLKAAITLPDLRLFTSGHSRYKIHLLTSTRNFIAWSLFDYSYNVGRHRRTQTVAMAQLDRELPEFSLSTEHFYHKIGEFIGFEDIDFDEYPEFSQKYRLIGKDENAVRQLFTPHVILTLLGEKLESNIEATGNFIIVYTPEKRVPPADLCRFFQKATAIVDLFK